MPAHHGRRHALGGPAYENLQGRKPRVMNDVGAARSNYGDLRTTAMKAYLADQMRTPARVPVHPETDWVAGVGGLELRYPGASHVFEMLG